MTCSTNNGTSLSDLSEPPLQRGYPTLSAYMSKTPENTILRRFSYLNTQNLLYCQAELISLETHLRQEEAAAAKTPSCDPQSGFARDWDWINFTGRDGCMKPQMALALRIRAVLKEYNELVLVQAGVSALPRPEPFDLKNLLDWIEDPKGGNFPLIGADDNWLQSSDLLALRRRNESDNFSRWIMEKLIPCYHHLLGHTYKRPSLDSNEISYSDSIILYGASMFAATLASLTIVCSVIILYEVKAMRARLGIMAASTVLFSLFLTLLTNAKRSDVFAVTAAFAAVQVVFIGSTYPNTQ